MDRSLQDDERGLGPVHHLSEPQVSSAPPLHHLSALPHNEAV